MRAFKNGSIAMRVPSAEPPVSKYVRTRIRFACRTSPVTAAALGIGALCVLLLSLPIPHPRLGMFAAQTRTDIADLKSPARDRVCRADRGSYDRDHFMALPDFHRLVPAYVGAGFLRRAHSLAEFRTAHAQLRLVVLVDRLTTDRKRTA